MLAEFITNVAIGMTAGSTLWLALRAGRVVIHAEAQTQMLKEIVTQQVELLHLQVEINRQLFRLIPGVGEWAPSEMPGDVSYKNPSKA